MRAFTQKYSHCRKVQMFLQGARTEELKVRVLVNWHKLLASNQLKRQQKEISHRMYRDRYITAFFRTWMDRYNKALKKKYLQEVLLFYRREKVRNRIFTKWMQEVTSAIDDQLRDKKAALEYQDRRMLSVIRALRTHCIRKKRERLIC